MVHENQSSFEWQTNQKAGFLTLGSIFTNGYWWGNMIFKVDFYLGWKLVSNSKEYKKLVQIPCPVLLFYTVCLLDSQEYVMWIFQKDHAAAKIPCNWALLYSIFFARKPTWSLIKISVCCWTECGPVSCILFFFTIWYSFLS